MVLRVWNSIVAPLQLFNLPLLLSYLADVSPRGGSIADQCLSLPKGFLFPDMQMPTFQLALSLVHLSLAHGRLAIERDLPGSLELLTWRAMRHTLLLQLRRLACLFQIYIHLVHLILLVLSVLS